MKFENSWKYFGKIKKIAKQSKKAYFIATYI